MDKKTLILISVKNNLKGSDVESLGAEFYNDIKRFMYLKRLFNRYDKSNELSERLVLNHLIVIFNVFGIKPSLRMLEFHIDNKYWYILKPFLIYLNYIKNDEYTNIEMDKEIVGRLRKI